MATTKSIGVVFQMFQTIRISIKFYVRTQSRNGNMLHCLLSNCEFIISDVTQSIVFQFLQNL